MSAHIRAFFHKSVYVQRFGSIQRKMLTFKPTYSEFSTIRLVRRGLAQKSIKCRLKGPLSLIKLIAQYKSFVRSPNLSIEVPLLRAVIAKSINTDVYILHKETFYSTRPKTENSFPAQYYSKCLESLRILKTLSAISRSLSFSLSERSA